MQLFWRGPTNQVGSEFAGQALLLPLHLLEQRRSERDRDEGSNGPRFQRLRHSAALGQALSQGGFHQPIPFVAAEFQVCGLALCGNPRRIG